MPLLFVQLSWVVIPGGWLESAHRLRVPMVIKTAGRVDCRMHSYCFAAEIPFGNPGMCAHSFDELYICTSRPIAPLVVSGEVVGGRYDDDVTPWQLPIAPSGEKAANFFNYWTFSSTVLVCFCKTEIPVENPAKNPDDESYTTGNLQAEFCAPCVFATQNSFPQEVLF
jgi:hypothetical protein